MLLKYLHQVAQQHVARVDVPSPDDGMQAAAKLLGLMVKNHDHRGNLPKSIKETIATLQPGDAFALHVVKQNAGIIFRRVSDTLQLEVFEASPVSEAVVNCQGRLRCTYPGPVTSISWGVAHDPAFLKELGAFLHHMDIHEFTDETTSKSRKGNNELSETRDTTDPRYIIELFTGMMRGIGKEISVSRITKNVRDEVNWNTAENPWRRSPLWLITRVALQTTLGRTQYKCFLLQVIRTILQQAIQFDIDSYSISCISKKLARRVRKLGEISIPDHLLQMIQGTVERGADLLAARWDTTNVESQRRVDEGFNLDHRANKSVRETKEIDTNRSGPQREVAPHQ
ncbi:hypothetical protein ABW20_dc0100511 [Dactylellina cionopaga]|nr:hypothetical protein ABW20_dc0100511 [Dactylellina cionopaga]